MTTGGLREGYVGNFARFLTGTMTAWALWQFLWVGRVTEWLNRSLPHPFSITFWLGAWGWTLAISLAATVTGKDEHARLALASAVVVMSMAVVSEALAADDDWWWQVGQSMVLLVVFTLFLVSPLRWTTHVVFPDDRSAE